MCKNHVGITCKSRGSITSEMSVYRCCLWTPTSERHTQEGQMMSRTSSRTWVCFCAPTWRNMPSWWRRSRTSMLSSWRYVVPQSSADNHQLGLCFLIRTRNCTSVSLHNRQLSLSSLGNWTSELCQWQHWRNLWEYVDPILNRINPRCTHWSSLVL